MKRNTVVGKKPLGKKKSKKTKQSLALLDCPSCWKDGVFLALLSHLQLTTVFYRCIFQ